MENNKSIFSNKFYCASLIRIECTLLLWRINFLLLALFGLTLNVMILKNLHKYFRSFFFIVKFTIKNYMIYTFWKHMICFFLKLFCQINLKDLFVVWNINGSHRYVWECCHGYMSNIFNFSLEKYKFKKTSCVFENT